MFLEHPTQKINQALRDYFFILPTPRLFKKALRLNRGPVNQLSLALSMICYSASGLLIKPITDQGCHLGRASRSDFV